MYSYEDRMKAVQLYIKYDLALADTVCQHFSGQFTKPLLVDAVVAIV
jgi:hypothetical protein